MLPRNGGSTVYNRKVPLDKRFLKRRPCQTLIFPDVANDVRTIRIPFFATAAGSRAKKIGKRALPAVGEEYSFLPRDSRKEIRRSFKNDARRIAAPVRCGRRACEK